MRVTRRKLSFLEIARRENSIRQAVHFIARSEREGGLSLGLCGGKEQAPVLPVSIRPGSGRRWSWLGIASNICTASSSSWGREGFAGKHACGIRRHTFASWYMMNGGDLYELAKILGHSIIKMTERYAKLPKDHIARTGSTAHGMWVLMAAERREQEQDLA
jgi:hypothetical protein